MGYPEHPNTVVIKNKYYPGGLREIDVWNHYQKYKNEIISEVRGRPVLLFIFVDVNKYVIRRNLYGSTFTLTHKTYDSLITGRTVSVSVEQELHTDYLVIDLDPGSGVTEHELKKCLNDLINSSLLRLPGVKNYSISNSSNSYHFYLHMMKKIPVNTGRQLLRKVLWSEFTGTYLIDQRNPGPGEINLDLTPNVPRGSHTVKWALCRNGLICKDITKSWKTFNRRRAIVQRSAMTQRR